MDIFYVFYILSGILFIVLLMDAYKVFGFCIKSPVIKIIIYLWVALSAVITFVVDLFMVFKR